MILRAIKAGLQTSMQAAPFHGFRSAGMPSAGAADCLSHAIANRLVGNATNHPSIEITLDDAQFLVEAGGICALSGASSSFQVNGTDVPVYQRIALKKNDNVYIGRANKGCRSYLALGGTLKFPSVLGSYSTYMPAKIGGHNGQPLRQNDIITSGPARAAISDDAMPEALRPSYSDSFILRTSIGPEFPALSNKSQAALFQQRFKVTQRASRMGLALSGETLEFSAAMQMASAPVFCGTIQCPPSGEPFLLGPDAQTTGGYARIAHVIRSDRHLIGQLRPGAAVQFVAVTPERARDIYQQKLALLKPWLGDISLW